MLVSQGNLEKEGKKQHLPPTSFPHHLSSSMLLLECFWLFNDPLKMPLELLSRRGCVGNSQITTFSDKTRTLLQLQCNESSLKMKVFNFQTFMTKVTYPLWHNMLFLHHRYFSNFLNSILAYLYSQISQEFSSYAKEGIRKRASKYLGLCFQYCFGSC